MPSKPTQKDPEMQTIHIDSSKDLQKARKLMLYPLLILIAYELISNLLIFLEIVILPFKVPDVIAVFYLAIYIAELIGFYHFSKLCNTFIFRFSVIYSCILLLLLIIFGVSVTMIWHFEHVAFKKLAALSFIAFFAVSIYLFYLVAIEMQKRTSLEDFFNSLMTYILSIISFAIFATFYIAFYDLISNLGLIANIELDMLQQFENIFINSFVSYMMIFFYIISLVFFARGVYNIKEVSIRT